MTTSVYLVKGGDDVLREEAVVQLVDKLVGGEDRSLLVDEFSGADYELAAVVDAAQTLPFLTDRRIVVARHFGRFGNAEAQAPMLAYLETPVDTTSLVLVWERSPEAGARLNAFPPKLKKALEAAAAETIDHEPPARQRDEWVGEQFSARGIKLDAAAKRLIAEQLGENAGAVVELIERSIGVHGPGASLRVPDIEPLLGEAGGVPPWELTDAIDKGDTALALSRLFRMMHGGDRHPLVIMSTLQSHYARMLRLDGAGVGNEKDAAQVLGLRGSTFPARKALSQVKKLGSPGIKRAVRLLADADVDLRGAQAWPEDLVMEVLVARLTRLSRVRG